MSCVRPHNLILEERGGLATPPLLLWLPMVAGTSLVPKEPEQNFCGCCHLLEGSQ